MRREVDMVSRVNQNWKVLLLFNQGEEVDATVESQGWGTMQVDGVKVSCCCCRKVVAVDAGAGEDEDGKEWEKEKGHENL